MTTADVVGTPPIAIQATPSLLRAHLREAVDAITSLETSIPTIEAWGGLLADVLSGGGRGGGGRARGRAPPQPPHTQ